MKSPHPHTTARTLPAGLALLTLLVGGAQAQVKPSPAAPVPYRVAAKLTDQVELLPLDAVTLHGYLGTRVTNNAKVRLPHVNEDALLAGFRRRPGEQAWIGEHVGKWLHAATLAWTNTGDPALRAKLDRVATELLKTQEPDGYLGTYVPSQRFGLYRDADWDVWVHKYNLIGLLTYYRYTGNAAALSGAKKIGDLLVRTFGPGKKSLLAASTQAGMAATSVLEPIVELYRVTGEVRYLDFAQYILQVWEEPNGPRVMTTLLEQKSVHKTANGKAYEMLSNLVGLCELARVTGDRKLLQPALNAWEDVVANQLYLTGTASHHEHFHAPHDLPNAPAANVGETCVTTTWIQLNSQLLRLTGEMRFANELERSYYNHLAAAQRPDGAQWCYYTALEGVKPYGPGINCCVSSGPRGMALLPPLAYMKSGKRGEEALVVNFLETSTVYASLGGKNVTLQQETAFPRGEQTPGGLLGTSTLTVRQGGPATFGLRLRPPAWATQLRAQVGGGAPMEVSAGDWLEIPARRWKVGDRITLRFTVVPRLVRGDHSNAGKATLAYGPYVLALDHARNPGLPTPRTVGLTSSSARDLRMVQAPGEPLAFEGPVENGEGKPATARFVPFSEAGSTGGRYAVWLRAPGTPLPKAASPFAFGDESRSRIGNVVGEIADGELGTFVVTFDNQPREEDWFSVARTEPISLRRVVYAHGKSFHDGGWFDAGAGKPRIEIQKVKDGPWITVGTLDEYPATTATDSRGLKDGQAFTLHLKEPVEAVAIRIAGKPAHGDNPRQAFTSCAELQGYRD